MDNSTQYVSIDGTTNNIEERKLLLEMSIILAQLGFSVEWSNGKFRAHKGLEVTHG